MPEGISRQLILESEELIVELGGLLYNLALYRNGALIPKMPAGLQLWWDYCDVEGEIANGGLFQYFSNKGEKYAAHVTRVIDWLETIGAGDTARILRDATDIWEEVLPTLRDADESGAIEDAERRFDPYEREFDKQEDAVESTLESYIKLHPDEFVFLPAGKSRSTRKAPPARKKKVAKAAKKKDKKRKQVQQESPPPKYLPELTHRGVVTLACAPDESRPGVVREDGTDKKYRFFRFHIRNPERYDDIPKGTRVVFAPSGYNVFVCGVDVE